jgi:hypothetical protein
MICTSLSPVGGACVGDVEGGVGAGASGAVVVDSELAAGAVSSELEAVSVVVISEGVETVLVELSVRGGVEEASTSAKAGRTTNAANTASAVIPAPTLENVTL